MAAVLKIENLTKDYRQGWARKRVRALDGLSLEVQEGEIYGFLGPNGAGKTTTIKILLNLIHATKGNAWLFGVPIGSSSLRRRVGYMPENPYFYRFLTAWEFLDFYGKLAGLHSSRRRERANELLNLVGLSEARDKRIGEFSKGMTQRIGLAQAMLNDPRIILMDEPLSGLDPIGRHDMRRMIEKFREQGKTIFFCSHVLSDVEALCDKVAILNRGKLIRTGAIADLISQQSQDTEITLADTEESRLEPLKELASTVHQRGDLVVVRCTEESNVEKVIQFALANSIRIHTVAPVRQNLEDYFMKEIASQSAAKEVVE